MNLSSATIKLIKKILSGNYKAQLLLNHMHMGHIYIIQGMQNIKRKIEND